MARQNHTFSQPVCQAPAFPKSEISLNPDQFALLSYAEIAAMRRCSAADMRIYAILGLHANPQGECWPGRQRLACMADMQPNHVGRALTRLESQGLIERFEGRNGITIYRLPLHRKPSSPQEPVQPKLVAEPAKPQPNLVARTDQPFEQTRERAEPAPTPAPAQKQPGSLPISSRKTPPPDVVPGAWIDTGQDLRQDLSKDSIICSAEKFLDHHRSLGTQLVDWNPAWRNWIRRERVDKNRLEPLKNGAEGKQASHQIYKPAERTQADVERDQHEWERHMERLGVFKEPAQQSQPLQSRIAALRQAIGKGS